MKWVLEAFCQAFHLPPTPCLQILNQQSYLLKTGMQEWRLLTSSASR